MHASVIAAALGSFLLVFANAGLVMKTAGYVSTLRSQSEPLADLKVSNPDGTFAISAPGPEWRLLRADASLSTSSSGISIWLVHPKVDAHIAVHEVHAPATLDGPKAVTLILDHLGKALPGFDLKSRTPFAFSVGYAEFVEHSATVGSVPVRYVRAIYVVDSDLYDVGAWAQAEFFQKLEKELNAAVRSFDLPD